MRFNNPIDRRVFLKGAGVAFASSLSTSSFANTQKSQTFFASSFRLVNGGFGILIFDEHGKSISTYKLPDRGHDITFNAQTGMGVSFARRPGNFALTFNLLNKSEPQIFIAPEGRHFYGHGVFSSDGKLLYASENNFEEGIGVIGIYDATNKFTRIGEFSSFGIGPHEILLHPNSNTLIVANGGIETHPDYGRAKLNLATMQPSLCFIDSATGQLLEKHTLPKTLHKLSIRHMDVSSNGKVIFGCQYEGDKSNTVPLVGAASIDDEIKLFDMPHSKLKSFANYVGSVSFSKDEKLVAVTLPKGNQVIVIDTVSGEIKKSVHQKRSFGVVGSKNDFLSTSELGFISSINGKAENLIPSLIFDNHLARFESF